VKNYFEDEEQLRGQVPRPRSHAHQSVVPQDPMAVSNKAVKHQGREFWNQTHPGHPCDRGELSTCQTGERPHPAGLPKDNQLYIYTELTVNKWQLILKLKTPRGVWVAQSVERLSPDFGSAQDLRVVRSSPGS